MLIDDSHVADSIPTSTYDMKWHLLEAVAELDVWINDATHGFLQFHPGTGYHQLSVPFQGMFHGSHEALHTRHAKQSRA